MLAHGGQNREEEETESHSNSSADVRLSVVLWIGSVFGSSLGEDWKRRKGREDEIRCVWEQKARDEEKTLRMICLVTSGPISPAVSPKTLKRPPDQKN